MTVPHDQADRARAIDPAGSFIVQAPAGSGKTELLIQRYLALLGTVERPEEILAITFTRKAAGEMRDRVLSALARARDERPPAEAHRARTWSLARAALARDQGLSWGLSESPSRLQVMTIDAFNALLVRRLPLVAGVGGPVTVTEDAAPLYEEAVRATLRNAGTGSTPARLARRLLAHLDNDFELAARQLTYLLTRRDHWLPRIMAARAEDAARRREVLEASLRREITRVLARAAAAFPTTLADECAALGAIAAGRLAADKPEHPIVACGGLSTLPPARADSLAAWQGLAELLLTGTGSWRKGRGINKNLGFPPDDRPAKDRMVELLDALRDDDRLGELLSEVRRLPPPVFDDGQWAILNDLLALLPICAGELALAFRRSGELDYVALAQHGRAALGDADAPTDLALAFDYRLRHILVDEFQDVSAAQVELIATLTAGWTDGDGRTLFCVGDPMQSIYRFREAEVALYLRTRTRGLGELRLEALTLATNFRSRAGLIDWYNDVFAGVFPAREQPAMGAVSYAASVAARSPGDGPAVTLAGAAPKDRAAEAAAVAEHVAALCAAAPDASIAVLVRARTHLAEIAPALRRRGIPYEAVDIEPLARRQPVQDLLALTRALCHLDDRTAWLAILRAPWCGLRLDDLARVGADREATIRDSLNDPDVIAALPAERGAAVQRLVRLVEAALKERGRRPLHRLVEGLWLGIGGPATLPDDTALTDARRFFELVRKLEVAGELPDPAALEARLDRLYAAADTGGRVQLMTIHKAKGLEFDHVVLPGLDRRPRVTQRPLLYWQETVADDGRTDLLLAPVEARGAGADPLQSYIAGLEQRRDGFELQRLLYVAATRARESLYLTACLPEENDDATLKTPAKGSLLALLWPGLEDAFRDRALGATPEAVASSPATLVRLASDWALPAPPAGVALPATAATVDADDADEGVAFDWAGEVVRVVGTVTHRYLERLADDGLAGWDRARIQGERARMEVLLAEGGVPEGRLKDAAALVTEALSTTLADADGRWILSAERRGGSSELPVAGLVGGRPVHRRIDRAFLDDDGVRWIVDFKISPHSGPDLETFLAEQQGRYRPQLDQYAGLLAALHPEEPRRRVALYFALQGRLLVWDAPT